MTSDVGYEWELPNPTPSPETALAALAAPLAEWFHDRFGQATPPQRLTWPTLASGKNLLLCAPTGTGKTLAAFLPILSRLLTETSAAGVRCLYVTPLQELGQDARKTL